MLVISLDEGGQFEGIGSHRGVVAGVAFSCNQKSDVYEEQKRIVNRLERICQNCNVSFPMDLHPQRGEKGKVVNQDALAKVHSEIEKTLGSFLQESKNGRYYLYAMVTEPMGADIFNQDRGNLLCDAYAGNRYLRMSQMAVRNMVINNPCLQADSYRLDLATRALPADRDKQPELYKQIKDMGLNRVWDNGKRKNDLFQLTDANTYISTLSSAILEEEREDLTFDINVQSISYTYNEESNRIQSFMWLADLVCGILYKSLEHSSEETTARIILEQFNQLTNHQENQVWCYDDVDFFLRDAINSRVQGDVFRCLEKLYTICSGRDQCSQFYRDVWAEKVFAQLKEDVLPSQVETAVSQLSYQVQQPNADMEQCRFIADRLLVLADAAGSGERCRYLLHSCLLTLCNHAGQVDQAEEHYRKCEEYAEAVSLDEYLQLRNSFSVTLLDRQHYGKALENTNETLRIAKLANQMRQEVFGKDSASITYGRCLSQLGQCYAYAGNHSQAQRHFLEALQVFQENSVDWQITCSYLLHSYIEDNKRMEYSQWAQRYFGEADDMKQLKNLFDMDNTTFAFAALVYLKSWYRFSPTRFPAKITAKRLDDIQAHGENTMGHPWELICKYVALLAKQNCPTRPDLEENAIAQLKEIREQNPDGLLKRICSHALETIDTGKEPTNSNLTYMHR